MNKKKKNSPILIGVSIILIVVAICAYFVLDKKGKEMFNEQIIYNVNESLKNMNISTYEDLEKGLAKTDFDKIKETSDELWYDIANQEIVLLSLSKAKKLGIELKPLIPEAFIPGYYFLPTKDDKFNNCIKKMRNIQNIEDIQEVINDIDSDLYQSFVNFINSTVFINSDAVSIIASIDNEVKEGEASHITNVLFSKDLTTIKEDTFTYQGDYITTITAMIIPSHIKTVEDGALQHIFGLQKLHCRDYSLSQKLKEEYSNIYTALPSEVKVTINDTITNIYTITLYNSYGKIDEVLSVTSSDDVSYLQNTIHYGITLNGNESYKTKGYVFDDDGQETHFSTDSVTKNYQLYPNPNGAISYVAHYCIAGDEAYYFETLHEAIDYASDKTVILKLISDDVIESDLVITSNITLHIPYSIDDINGTADGTTSESRTLATDDKRYLTLTINKETTINIEGTVIIGGVISYPSQFYQGHTSGAHSTIVNDGKIIITGALKCYGYVKGNGSCTVGAGGKLYQPFVVTDFAGGTNTLALYQAKQSPFSRYGLVNVLNEIRIEYKGLMIGYCNLYASQQYNKCEATIIGYQDQIVQDQIVQGQKGLINLTENSYITITFDSENKLQATTPLGNNLGGDLPKIKIDIWGGASFDPMVLKIMAVTISTENVDFPIPYLYDITLNDGTYYANTNYKLLPGARITVNNKATLITNKNFFVFEAFGPEDLSGKAYPSSFLLESSGYSKDGELIVNGTLIINSSFGGFIQTTGNTGEIIVNSSALSQQVISGVIVEGQAPRSNKTTYQIDAKVASIDGYIVLEENKTYKANANITYVNEKVSYQATDINGIVIGREIIINEEIVGGFVSNN